MGYYINQRFQKFRIPVEKQDACLEAIKAIGGGSPNVGNGGGYSWVSEYANATSLTEAMNAWRWAIYPDPHQGGDVTEIEFHGEKLGDDEVLWAAIAPFVDAGSYIEMSGEEGEVWRWVFNGTGFETHYARLVFDYERAND